MKRVMVDMSATILHYGHTRLIAKAAEYGDVIIGLTTDDQIREIKGYEPEVSYDHRKEVLESVKGVKEVVPTPWLLTEEVLDKYSVDLLVHGHDNSNPISPERLLVLPRTEGISSTEIRRRAMRSIASLNNDKLMLTPGPAVVLHENLEQLRPVFGRGDEAYQQMASAVTEWVKRLSGQDELVVAQGSATFALELAAYAFVTGKVLLVSTGYYSDRLAKLLPKGCETTSVQYQELEDVEGNYDWVMCAYTETSTAFLVDIKFVRQVTDNLGARLFVDSTGSIGLESHHELCDVTAFSSCKGLFGLTGAAFVAYKNELKPTALPNFYFNIETHQQHMVTGPYHVIASLYGVMNMHEKLRERVVASKQLVMERFSDFIPTRDNQPLLCTYLSGEVVPSDDNIVLYSPRSDSPGSVICHFGEIHKDSMRLTERIQVNPIV